MNNGKQLEIEYTRDGQTYSTILVPKYSEEENRYFIGLSGSGEYINCNNLSVFKYSVYEVRYWLIATYRSLAYMFSGHASMDDLSGPVGIATVIDDTIEETSQYGVFTVLLNMVNIAVLLSVNLGVLNLLPFPAFDGGRILFLIIEKIKGSPVKPEVENLVHTIGFFILLALIVFVTFNDVIVDAVGVTKSKKTETRTLETKPSVSMKELMLNVAMGAKDEETLTSLAGRIARLNNQLTPTERKEFTKQVVTTI